MRDAVVAAWRGELTAPPRVTAKLDQRRLVYSCGAVERDWIGYRSYLAPGSTGDDQVVVVQDSRSGRLRAMAVGQVLGPRRVGAIGAVALDAMVPDAPEMIALIGSGRQAWHQLWALPPRGSVKCRSGSTHAHLPPGPGSRSGPVTSWACMSRRPTPSPPPSAMQESSSWPPRPRPRCSTPRTSRQGLRQHPRAQAGGRAELDRDLARGAGLLVTDSPEQVRAYDPPHVLAGTDADASMVHLGALLTGERPVPDATRVFLNVGLAGTEAWLLDAVARSDTEGAAPGPPQGRS